MLDPVRLAPDLLRQRPEPEFRAQDAEHAMNGSGSLRLSSGNPRDYDANPRIGDGDSRKLDVNPQIEAESRLMAGYEVRGTLRSGFPAWVLSKYARATQKDDLAALEYILERWANLDSEAERYGVTLQAFQLETEGAEIVDLSSEKNRRKGKNGAE